MHLSKTPQNYFKVDPWLVVEEGFDPSRQRIAESIFVSANEYMCVRGYFEEGYSGNHLRGSYFNQLYDYIDYHYPNAFNGFVNRGACMINAVDWLYTRIMLDGEQLDLAHSQFPGFMRVMNMRTAVMSREFTWTTVGGKRLKLRFERFTNADKTNDVTQLIRAGKCVSMGLKTRRNERQEIHDGKQDPHIAGSGCRQEHP